MSGGFAPRFALEAGFLILLGVGAGYANLRPVVIVALLAGAWLLVSLVEVTAWYARGRSVAVGMPAPPEVVEPEPGWPDEPVEPVYEAAYPLRSDAGAEQSEEVEAYTRVLEPEADEQAGESR